MRVLLANSDCKVGGVSTFMLSMRGALLALGHECELFFFERGSMEPYLPPGCPVHFGGLAECLRLVQRRDFAVVHANNVDWRTGIAAVRRTGARLVLTAHKVRPPAGTYGWTRANCDALVGVARWIRNGLQPYTDVPIQVVPNGIDTARFTPAAAHDRNGRPIVVWVGRGGAPRKRLEAFAAIAPILRDAGIRIWVIDQQGPEVLARAHPTAAATLQAAAERWSGVPFEEMPSVYRDVAASGGAIVFTSSMEGLPLTLLEAQACGCVPIGADVAGVNECISPDHGGVLYPIDLPADALGRLVVATLADRRHALERGVRAMQHVRETFSLRRMAEDYLRVYTQPHAPATLAMGARLRGRLRLSPLVNWRGYVGTRAGVGYKQYDTSQALASEGAWRLAAASARAALATGPTIFLRPERLAHLVRAQLRSLSGKVIRDAAAGTETI
jgi:glycosyltransferase involved in cell wall biosynthesis